MGSCPKPGCNYTSNRANNLSRHMRTHNGAPSPLRMPPSQWASPSSTSDDVWTQGSSRTAARRRAAGMRRATRGRSAGTSTETVDDGRRS